MPVASIIIPLYNQWQLTRDCLRSLKATAPVAEVELILVDNASSDVTAQAAPFLGKEIFGKNFTYIRNEQNRNFAGACNQGAAAATGDFLIFLNNDTVALPGWLEPLLADFREFPNLAGTGPLLLYPENGLLGHTVQHLGVALSPFRKVNHLYEGIPAASPLANKRRFFQVITAACLMLPKDLFAKAGGFDEAYKNGFEDVDLCARLAARGLRFTVNPAARVIHYQGQSVGRRASEAQNSQLLEKKALPLLHADKEDLLHADSLNLGLNEWQIQVPLPPSDLSDRLEERLPGMDREEVLSELARNPFWSGGWKKLLREADAREVESLASSVFKLVPEPAIPIRAAYAALQRGDRSRARYWFNTAKAFCLPASVYLDSSQYQASFAAHLGEKKLARAYSLWSKDADKFFRDALHPFIADFARLARELDVPAMPAAPWAFALDFDLSRENPYGGAARDFNAIAYRKKLAEMGKAVLDPWQHYLSELQEGESG